MGDVFTKTEHRGFFSRLFGSFIGVLIGLLCIPGSVMLLGWNEYRTIHRTRGLIEAANVVKEVADPFEPASEFDGKLIHFSGKADTQEKLVDSDFHFESVALRMERQVEMYQWIERKETKTRNKTGGGSETVTTYHYDQNWHADRVNSDSFEHSTGHSNPSLLYASETQETQHATVGEYRLRQDLLRSIHSWHDIAPAQVPVEQLGNPQLQFTREGNYIYLGHQTPNPEHPQIGDHRIRFRVVEPTQVSVLSMQKGNLLEPYRTSNGESIERLQEGNVSAVDMFSALRMENTAIAWVLRFVGWFVSIIGFVLIAGPLKSIANVLPFLGNIVGTATFLLALFLGSCLSMVVIATAWIAVRPLYGLSLLAAVAILVYWFNRRTKASQPGMPPPLPV